MIRNVISILILSLCITAKVQASSGQIKSDVGTGIPAAGSFFQAAQGGAPDAGGWSLNFAAMSATAKPVSLGFNHMTGALQPGQAANSTSSSTGTNPANVNMSLRLAVKSATCTCAGGGSGPTQAQITFHAYTNGTVPSGFARYDALKVTDYPYVYSVSAGTPTSPASVNWSSYPVNYGGSLDGYIPADDTDLVGHYTVNSTGLSCPGLHAYVIAKTASTNTGTPLNNTYDADLVVCASGSSPGPATITVVNF